MERFEVKGTEETKLITYTLNADSFKQAVEKFHKMYPVATITHVYLESNWLEHIKLN